ncbi:hypothetical protein TI04_02655 [Achromatium sp. WMS2]|nr:hypothetical protein TI04_02655 [Achromatium sp. WMS2]
MFTLLLVVATAVWAAMFILPLVGYAALGLSLLKDAFAQGTAKPRSSSRHGTLFTPSFTHS